MIEVKTIRDVCPAINELINSLNQNERQQKLASILKGRMYEVSWTFGSELLRDLSEVLKEFVKADRPSFDEITLNQIEKIIQVIDSGLAELDK